MPRFLFLLVALLFSILYLAGQTFPVESSRPVNPVSPRTENINRINSWLQTGYAHLLQPGANTRDFDSAFYYFTQAGQLSSAIHDPKSQNESLARLGDYYFIRKDPAQGKACYMQVIDYYHKAGNRNEEEIYQGRLIGITNAANQRAAPDNIQTMGAARLSVNATPNTLEKIDAFKKTVYAHIKDGKLDLAEKELLQILAQYNALGYHKLREVYELLAEVSKLETDLHKELYYKLELIRNMEETKDTTRADYFYSKLALTYADLGMFDQSINWIMKSIRLTKNNNNREDFYGDVSLIIFDYISENKAETALSFLRKTMKETPPDNMAQKIDLSEAFGNCYAALKQYSRAEQYYLEMMRQFQITSFNKVYYTSNYWMITDYIHYYQTMGNFYVLTKQWKKAGENFGKILALPKGDVRPVTLNKIHLAQFRVDSALGNYISAIKHFEIHKDINDSLFNSIKAKQIEELEIKYESEKKDKDLQLKQDNIVMLTNKSLLQEVNLKKANFSRNVIIVSSILLCALLCTGYRFKQRSNIKLQSQQREINNKNQRLEQLLTEQQKLTIQKEWLVREIHHRVKNNLQIVISLLNVQSGFLDNPTAIQAIRESRERMQAISLIHQKLYQPDTGVQIDLKSYIQEMVLYMQDSFSDYEKITYKLHIDPITIDVSQGVPLGIILNELITNSVKYAFPAGHKGIITISAQQISEHHILLKITDNGKGFPGNFDLADNNSLGIQLIKLFAGQLDGELNFSNKNGAEITLLFKQQYSVYPIS